MQQRTGITQLKTRLARIRGRQTFLGRKATETLNESHTREFLLRAVALPHIKATLGNKLRAVLLVGSTQLGIRKATRKKRKSDLDILIIVKTSTTEDEITAATEPISEKCEKLHTPVSFMINYGAPQFGFYTFKIDQLRSKEPLQIIYGKKWVEEELGPKHMALMPRLKRKALKNPKYLGRE
jgi:hypothetical protein